MSDFIFDTLVKTLKSFCKDSKVIINAETKIVEDLGLESVDFVEFIFDLEEALDMKLNFIEMNIALSKGGSRRFRELTVADIDEYLRKIKN